MHFSVLILLPRCSRWAGPPLSFGVRDNDSQVFLQAEIRVRSPHRAPDHLIRLSLGASRSQTAEPLKECPLLTVVTTSLSGRLQDAGCKFKNDPWLASRKV